MPMTVVVDLLTGATPTVQSVASINHNREDSPAGSTPVPVPVATGTNFSWIKSLQVEITATGGLQMTNIRVGKSGTEAITGVKLWHCTTHSAYTQATGSPTATVDNNSTPPTLNGAVATAVALNSAPPNVYSAGPYSAVARVGNIVEVVAGVDNTCTTTGNGNQLPALIFSWVES